jgi:diguanylate cyclase (GGDEF)-like protein
VTSILPSLVVVPRLPLTLDHGWAAEEGGRAVRLELELGADAVRRPLGLDVGGVLDGDRFFLDGVPLASARLERRVGGRRLDRVLAVAPASTTAGRHVFLARLAPRAAGEPAFTEAPRLDALDELLHERAARNLPQLAAAVATASFALLALLFFLRDPRRRDLGLYALFAAGVSLFLASPLPIAARAPPAVERGLDALVFLLPAMGYLFVLRFLSLAVTRLRLALLALPAAGLLVLFAHPASERALAVLSAATLLVLGLELLVALARGRRAGPDTPFLFLGTALLLLAALVDAVRARGALVPSGVRVTFLGPAFLLFTALLLVAVADEGKRLLLRATTDPLTGILNREEFVRRAGAEIARAERTGGSLALAMLDVDHFKSFNDRFGHQAGDRVLVAAAQAIAESARGLDVVGRYGGEEFVVLLVNAAEASSGAAVERIRAAISALEPPRVPERVTASAGVAVHNGLFERASLRSLVKLADLALYEAKRGGRDRTVVADAPSGAPKSVAEVRYR